MGVCSHTSVSSVVSGLERLAKQVHEIIGSTVDDLVAACITYQSRRQQRLALAAVPRSGVEELDAALANVFRRSLLSEVAAHARRDLATQAARRLRLVLGQSSLIDEVLEGGLAGCFDIVVLKEIDSDAGDIGGLVLDLYDLEDRLVEQISQAIERLRVSDDSWTSTLWKSLCSRISEVSGQPVPAALSRSFESPAHRQAMDAAGELLLSVAVSLLLSFDDLDALGDSGLVHFVVSV